MGTPGDKEKAVGLLKLAMEKRAASQTVSISTLPLNVDASSTGTSDSSQLKTPQKRNVLSRCFDKALSTATCYEQECDEYLNSKPLINMNEDDEGDSKSCLYQFPLDDENNRSISVFDAGIASI